MHPRHACRPELHTACGNIRKIPTNHNSMLNKKKTERESFAWGKVSNVKHVAGHAWALGVKLRQIYLFTSEWQQKDISCVFRVDFLFPPSDATVNNPLGEYLLLFFSFPKPMRYFPNINRFHWVTWKLSGSSIKRINLNQAVNLIYVSFPGFVAAERVSDFR